jgi:hypothetical protein
VTRVTLNLPPSLSTALHRWIQRAAVDIGPPFVTEDEVLVAALVVALRYSDVSTAVQNQLKQQRAAANRKARILQSALVGVMA